MTISTKGIEQSARAWLKISDTLLTAIRHQPYGWGEYRDQVDTWETEIFQVRRGAQLLNVECLLHLQENRQLPLYINFGGFSTPATLYGPLGRTVWQRGLNAIMVSLPGHGFTDLPEPKYRSYRASAKIVYEAINQARRKYGLTGEMRVLGHSHGGGVAEGLAAVAGDEIARYYLLAAVGGLEWSRICRGFTEAMAHLRSGRIYSSEVIDSWRRLSGFVSDGYIFVPPPWELAGWRAELVRPFKRGWHKNSASNLYAVMIDTLLGSAEELETCLQVMSQLRSETIILAGKADGVISREVVSAQASALAKPGQVTAPIFRSNTTHTGFLAAAGRNYVAKLVSMPDVTLQSLLQLQRRAA